MLAARAFLTQTLAGVILVVFGGTLAAIGGLGEPLSTMIVGGGLALIPAAMKSSAPPPTNGSTKSD